MLNLFYVDEEFAKRFIQKTFIVLLFAFCIIKVSIAQGTFVRTETTVSDGSTYIGIDGEEIVSITFNVSSNNTLVSNKQGFRTLSLFNWILVDPEIPSYPMWSEFDYSNNITITITTVNGHSITGGSITVKALMDTSSSSISHPSNGFWRRTIVIGSDTVVLTNLSSTSNATVSHTFSNVNVSANSTNVLSTSRINRNKGEATTGYSFIQVFPNLGLTLKWLFSLNYN